MSRYRQSSLNLRTPIGGIYGNDPPYYSTSYRSPSRSRQRYCRNCIKAFYPVIPPTSVIPASAPLYPIPCMIPMVIAPMPVHMASSAPMPQPVLHDEPLPMPELPRTPYEMADTDSEGLDELRTEETLSTMQRTNLRQTDYLSSSANLIKDFEETKWIPIDDKMTHMGDWTMKRDHWFQRSIELPCGIITQLCCERMSADSTSGTASMRRSTLQRIRISGRVKHWSSYMNGIVEEEFEEVVLLPYGTDMNSITYKLQTKNLQQFSERHYNHTLRHHSTADTNELEDPPFTENTVVVTGRVDPVPVQPEPATATRTWSKEYTQTVHGTVDLAPDGNVVNPTITSYSEIPDALTKLAPTPDQDTSYSIFKDSLLIRIRLDENVDRNSINLVQDQRQGTLKVEFARHSGDAANGLDVDDDTQPTTTTNYDLMMNQTFSLPPEKFDITRITQRVSGDELSIFIPFAKGFQPSSLNA